MISSRKTIKTIKTKEELEKALKEIPDSLHNIVFHNVIQTLSIGNRLLEENYPSVLYTDNSIIILGNDTLLSTKEFEQIAYDNRKAGVVSFIPPQKNTRKYEEKEIKPVSNLYNLLDEIYERKDEDDYFCTYYPKTKGTIGLYYELEEGERVPIEETKIVGLLEFDKKILALTMPASHKAMIELLSHEQIDSNYDWSVECPLHNQKVNIYKKREN